MDELFIGIDCGRFSIKTVVIDKYNNILYSYCILIDRSIILCIKDLFKDINRDIDMDKYIIKNIGVTGINRRIVGCILNSKNIKNEVVALDYYISKINKDINLVIDMDSGYGKIFNINNRKIVDYRVNNDINLISGKYMYDIKKRLDVRIDNCCINNLFSKKCMIYIDEDVNKYINMGYDKNLIMGGLCKRYIDNIYDYIKDKDKILFIGGLSVYDKIINGFNNKININNKMYVLALGIGMMARDCGLDFIYDKDFYNKDYFIKIDNCFKCNNNCFITKIYLDKDLIDCYGYRCYKWDK